MVPRRPHKSENASSNLASATEQSNYFIRMLYMRHWLNWIEQEASILQVVGSNPIWRANAGIV